MSEVPDVEIGKLIEKVDTLETIIRDNNTRLYLLEKELTKAKGMGIGIFLMAIGGTSVITSIVTRWMNQ